MKTITLYKVQYMESWDYPTVYAVFEDETVAREFKQYLENPRFAHMFKYDDATIQVEKEIFHVAGGKEEAEEYFLHNFYQPEEK